MEFIEYGNINKFESFPFIVLGNKMDEEAKREVDEQTVNKFKKDHPQLKHFMVSAKSREGVDAVFQKIALASIQKKE